MDAGRPLYPQRVGKTSPDAIRGILAKVETNPRDYEKRMAGTRFTARGFERLAPRQFDASWQKDGTEPRDYEKPQDRIGPLSNPIVGVQFDEILKIFKN